MEYASFRALTVEMRLTDAKIPNVVRDMALKGVSTEEREKARAEAHKDVEALNCEYCPYKDNCNYKNSPERLPNFCKGGKGGCLRYYTERAGGFGFMTPRGEPFFIDEAAAKAIKEALKRF